VKAVGNEKRVRIKIKHLAHFLDDREQNRRIVYRNVKLELRFSRVMADPYEAERLSDLKKTLIRCLRNRFYTRNLMRTVKSEKTLPIKGGSIR